MLYKQTAGQSAMMEAILGFDVKVFKSSIKLTQSGQISDIKKLEAVVHQLQSLRLVGDLDEGKPYVRGSLKLKFGGYGEYSAAPSPIAFWGGANLDYPNRDLAFAMAGSRRNLIGEATEVQCTASSHSLTDQMVKWFLTNIRDPEEPPEPVPTDHQIDHRVLDDYDVANGTYLAASQMGGISGRFQFIAKVLHRSTWKDGFRASSCNRILLATPLYVALDES